MAIFQRVQSWPIMYHSRSSRYYQHHAGVAFFDQRRQLLLDIEVSQLLSDFHCSLFELAAETVEIELFAAIDVRLIAVVAVTIIWITVGLIV